jgi:release factor glutamine methyltransferase
MTVHTTFQRLQSDLSTVYEEQEAGNIADWVMEKITGWKKMDRVVNKQVSLSARQQEQLSSFTSELLTHRPVQYVLEEAWFAGMRFYVNENVLIPRPETEELVAWIIADSQREAATKKIIDIGTGSGCIPIAIKKKLPAADVYGCDISKAALVIANSNARLLKTDVLFIESDILDETAHSKLPYVDIIVSNPPYIPQSEKESMRRNVLDFEPHLALFVSDADPLLFYKKVADLASKRLIENGSVYLEIHEDLGTEVTGLLKEKGFNKVELRKDMQGRDRMVKAAY